MRCLGLIYASSRRIEALPLGECFQGVINYPTLGMLDRGETNGILYARASNIPEKKLFCVSMGTKRRKFYIRMNSLTKF